MAERSSSVFPAALRALVCLAALAMAASAGFVFAAARAAEAAFNQAQAALEFETPAARGRALRAGVAMIRESRARPGDWHAGAQETLSWSYAALAEIERGSDQIRDSIEAAEQSLARAPLQPNAWARLAAFSAGGATNRLCAAQDCLARSWRAVPLARYDLHCARLRLGHNLGLVEGPGHEQIQLLTRVRLERENFLACLAFLSPEQSFQALIDRNAEASLRQARERAAGRSPSPFFD